MTDTDQHTVEMYRKDPAPVLTSWKFYLPVLQGTIKPAKTHHLIKLFHDKNILLKYYTQNIDGLEDKVGVPKEKIVRAHGTLSTGVCLDCKFEYSEEKMTELFWPRIAADIIPKCTQCGSKTAIKPNIVFFQEPLPKVFDDSSKIDFQQCDLLIVLGTSMKVYPFAGLVDLVREDVPRLLINRECVGPFVHGVKQYENGQTEQGIPGTYRDVAYVGDIDKGVELLLKGLHN